MEAGAVQICFWKAEPLHHFAASGSSAGVLGWPRVLASVLPTATSLRRPQLRASPELWYFSRDIWQSQRAAPAALHPAQSNREQTWQVKGTTDKPSSQRDSSALPTPHLQHKQPRDNTERQMHHFGFFFFDFLFFYSFLSFATTHASY